jgi:dTDP-4-dehydrorhamnose 3,5-epimerase-like enzyme
MDTDKITIAHLPDRIDGNSPRRIVELRGEMAILHPVGPVYNPVYFDAEPGPGNVRGQHYHKTKTEVFYVISGSCRLSYLDLDTGVAGKVTARPGDMVTIMPRCAHSLEALELCRVFEFSLHDVEYARDTVGYTLV